MRRLFVAAFVVAFSLWIQTAGASAQTTCPAANPYDNLPDDGALQACLDAGGTITLEPASSPGYIIEWGLVLRHNNTTLTSQGPGKARIMAANDLWGPILQTDGFVSGFQISWINFDGRKWARNMYCDSGYRWYAYNLWLRGFGFVVHNVESQQAPCGSAMEVDGSWYEIRNNYVANNGRPREGSSDPEPWADGITLISCDNGYVHDNTLVDNTDIDIVVGGGPNCRIQNNSISHNNVYGFAGIHVGSFNQNGNHGGSDYSGNTVMSQPDKLGFGIIAGFHPWDPGVPVPDAGSTAYNSSSGAVVNLAVDGIDGGSVQSNGWSGATGTRGFNCDIAADYTAGHFGASSIQGGYACRIYHAPYCQSTCG